MQAACVSYPTPEHITEQIHVQTSKVGLIAAEIAKILAAPELATHENIQMLNEKLEKWRSEVPSSLTIASLTSPNPPPMTLYQRRAILMVHVSISHTSMATWSKSHAH